MTRAAFSALLALGWVTACGPKRPAPLPLGDNGLPTADALLARSMDAVGGKAVVESHQNRVMMGKVEMPAQGITMTMEIRQQAPDRMLTRSEIPGIGAMEQGTDGTLAWSIDPMIGPRLLEGTEASSLMRRADMLSFSHMPEVYPIRETIGQEPIDGEPCWLLRLVDTDGAEERMWLSQAQGWPLAQEMTLESDMGRVTVRTLLQDYQDRGGMFTAMRMVQQVGPISMITTLESLEVDRADFQDIVAPAEIRALANP